MNVTPEFYRIVSDEASKPFCYGSNDCSLFVDSIYRRAFGIDIAKDIRGSYNDKLGASKVLVREGGLSNILLQRGFIKLENKYRVGAGDIVMAEGAVGIWLGDKAIFVGGVFRTIKKIEEVYIIK